MAGSGHDARRNLGAQEVGAGVEAGPLLGVFQVARGLVEKRQPQGGVEGNAVLTALRVGRHDDGGALEEVEVVRVSGGYGRLVRDSVEPFGHGDPEREGGGVLVHKGGERELRALHGRGARGLAYGRPPGGYAIGDDPAPFHALNPVQHGAGVLRTAADLALRVGGTLARRGKRGACHHAVILEGGALGGTTVLGRVGGGVGVDGGFAGDRESLAAGVVVVGTGRPARDHRNSFVHAI